MKKIALLFTGLFICIVALGTTKTWTGASSTSPTDWGDPTNWSPSGVPVYTDDVEIPDKGLAGPYPVISSAASCNIMQLATNATFTINSGVGSWLEINSNFTCSSGGNTVTVSGILRFTGSAGTFSGTATISGSGSVEVQASYTLTIDGTLTVNTALNQSGAIIVLASRIMTVNGSFTASGSSTIAIGYNGFTSSFVTTGDFAWNSSGNITFNYGGIFGFGGTSTSQVVSSNVTFTGWGAVDVASTRTLNISGTLTANSDFTHSGIINVHATGTLTVYGTFTASGSAEVHVSTTGSGGLIVIGGNLQYNSSTDIDLQNNGILRFGGSAGGTFSRSVGGTAVISGTGSVETQASYLLTVDGNVTVNTSLNHSGAIQVAAACTMTVNGSFTASGSSTISVGYNGYTSAFMTTGAFNYTSTGFIYLNYGGIFGFGGTSTSIVISSNVTFTGWGAVDVASTRTLNISGTMTANSDFTHAGIINIHATGALTVYGTFVASGSAEVHVSTTGSGGLFVMGGNLQYNSSTDIDLQNNGILRFGGSAGGIFSRPVGGTAVISGTGSVETQASYLLTVDGNVTVNTSLNHSGAIQVAAACTMTVNGSFTASGSSTISVGYNGYTSALVTTGAFNYTSTGFIYLNYGGIFGFGGTSTSIVISSNVTFTGWGAVDVASTRTLNISGTMTANSDFTHAGIINIHATGALTVYGTFVASGSAEVHVSTTGSGGLFVMGGILQYNSSADIDLQNNGILRFGGTAGGTLSRSVGGTAVISGSGSVEIQASYLLTIDGDVSVNTSLNNSGSIQVAAARTVTVNGSFTASGSSTLTVGYNGYSSLFSTTGAFTWNSSGNIFLNYNAGFQFGGTGTGVTISTNLTIDGWGAVDVAGTRTLNINSTLTVNSTLTASGDAEIHLSTTGSGGTLVLNGTVSYTSSKVIDLQTNGILRFGGSGNPTFTGTATISGAGTAEIPATFILYVDGTLTVNSVFNLEGQLNISATRTMTVSGNVIAGGSSSIYVGYNGYSSVFITTGDFTYNSSTAINLNYDAIFRFGGTNASFKRTLPGIATITNVYIAAVEVTGTRTLYVDCDLAINAPLNNSGIIQINAGKDLTVSGNTTISLPEGLVIKSDVTGTGSFIDNGTITRTGSVKVERYLTGYTSSSDKKFHILSAPVSSFPIQPEFVNLPNLTDDFYKFDETINSWINTRNGAGSWNSDFESNFQEGRGYLVAYPTNLTKTFTGSLNTYPSSSPKTLNCTWTDPAGGGGGGWNMLGNPFPSSIDWTLVNKGTAMDNALYYYDASIQNYRYYVQYLPGISVGGGSRYIPAMQGFFVHANYDATPSNQTITLDNSMRVHQSLSTYYKDTETPLSNYLVLKVDGNNFSDETYICFHEQATANFDRAFDAYKINSMNTDVPMIYTVTPGDTNIAINTLPPAAKVNPLPLGFKTPADGSYSITADQLYTFPPGVIITLEDKKAGKTQNLMQNPVYAFTGSPGDDQKRFLLHFSGPIGIGEKKKDPGIQIYTSRDVIYVSGDHDLANANIYIFNIIGQKIYSGLLKQIGPNPIRINGRTGYYIVKVITGNDAVTKKVYL